MQILAPTEPRRLYDSRVGEPVWANPDTAKGPLADGETRAIYVGYRWAGLNLVGISNGPGYLSVSGVPGGNATSVVNFDADGISTGNIIIDLPSRWVYVTSKHSTADFVIDLSVTDVDVVVPTPPTGVTQAQMVAYIEARLSQYTTQQNGFGR